MNDKCVYFHINSMTDEIFYVGIGSSNRPYSKKSRSNIWHNVVNKYGYKISIIHENISWDEACKKEILFIKKFGRRDIKTGVLINMTDGGDGQYNPSQEAREKHRLFLKGKPGINKGKKLNYSLEERQRRVLFLKGKPAINKGKKLQKHSKETKDKRRESLAKFYYNKHKNETINIDLHLG